MPPTTTTEAGATEREHCLRWAERLAASAYHKGFCEGIITISVMWTVLVVLLVLKCWIG
jgi:hypothetical protein